MSVSVTVDQRALEALLANWESGMNALVRKVAADVLHDAQANIKRNGQIKTGHMLNSGQVEPGENATTMYVHFAANYSGFQELGTRYMAGRPFLTPAVERNRSKLAHDFSAFLGSFVER